MAFLDWMVSEHDRQHWRREFHVHMYIWINYKK
jgi:hypothetical protein